MPSPSEARPAALLARDDRLIAGFAALAIAIHILEAAFPSPLPGVKPGLANVVTVVVLLRYGWYTAAWVSALRVLAGSLLVGTFLSPTFIMSASGAAAALLVLWLARQLAGRWLGALGYSVCAALAHMGTQLLVAFLLFIPHPALWTLAPFLLTAALVFGIVSGVIAASVLMKLEPEPEATRA
ncbi:MAG: Gx transporter family protein [Gammaproteobacteria bacterium]